MDCSGRGGADGSPAARAGADGSPAASAGAGGASAAALVLVMIDWTFFILNLAFLFDRVKSKCWKAFGGFCP